VKLRYLIGKDSDPGQADAITVIGYDADTPPRLGIGVKYCNLLDEKASREFAPYLPDNDMTAEYGEPVPDPAGDGFWRNLRSQLDLAVRQGFTEVELDNLDSYTASVALMCFNEAQSRGLRVFVKNPFLVDGDNAALMRHPAAIGAIVEPDCGTPDQMQAIRNGLPVYFVSGDYDDPNISFPNLSTGQPMATNAEIIAKARSYIGQLNDGPDVPRIAREIGKTFPEFANYVKEANNDTPWCGIFCAYVLSQFGIKPPPTTGGVGFMWVDTWAKWGSSVPVGNAQPGDLALFLGGPHHITFCAGNGRYVGGNQGDAVTEASFRTPDYVRRAAAANAQPVVSSSRFAICLPRVLVHEGGNDDNPDDPGGRTSRGITAARWAEWRQTHPGLPADVWQAPQADVVAIYRQYYWDALLCDQLPPGVDYAVFDFGVNSGPSRSAKFLQEIVGSDVDGEVGPNTIAATRAADPEEVINRLCDDRMEFLQGLPTWGTFGRGWTNRVNDVRRDALSDVVLLPDAPTIPAPPVVIPDNPPATKEDAYARILEAVALLKEIDRVAQQPVVQQQFDWGKLLQPLIAELAPKIMPMLMPIIVQYLPQLLPMLLQAMFNRPAYVAETKTGMSTAATAGVVGGTALGSGIIGSLITAFLKGP
jgi:lysozyme family protein